MKLISYSLLHSHIVIKVELDATGITKNIAINYIQLQVG